MAKSILKLIKSNIKYFFIPLNIFILLGLYYLLQYLEKQKSLVEGVINSNCCGGIEAGVHYQETDTSPPDYVRRCFKSSRINGEIVYDWSGFPCSSEDSVQCCTDSDGRDIGQCIPSTKGGYCKDGNSNKIFRRGESSASSYIKRSDDNLIDINNTVEMEDYFYDRSQGDRERNMSSDMINFLNRRDRNSAYIQSHIVERNRQEIMRQVQARQDATKDKKRMQIKTSIIAVHLLFLLTFAILIKDLIIKDIDTYYDMLAVRYLEFTGKTIQSATQQAVAN